MRNHVIIVIFLCIACHSGSKNQTFLPIYSNEMRGRFATSDSLIDNHFDRLLVLANRFAPQVNGNLRYLRIWQEFAASDSVKLLEIVQDDTAIAASLILFKYNSNPYDEKAVTHTKTALRPHTSWEKVTNHIREFDFTNLKSVEHIPGYDLPMGGDLIVLEVVNGPIHQFYSWPGYQLFLQDVNVRKMLNFISYFEEELNVNLKVPTLK